jgi:Fe-S-cluster containining protein
MQENGNLFLSAREAVEAVSIALCQYSFQFNLISAVWPLAFGRDAYVMRDSNRRDYWAKTAKHGKLLAAGEDDLKQLVANQLKQSWPPLDTLALICRQVFGTPTHAVLQSSTGEGTGGIWIKIDMTDFQCIQCGHCCRTLNYRDGCSLDDYRRWQKLGRDDILDWVGTVQKDGDIIACRIWMEPGTNQYAEICPWLQQVDRSGRSLCTIYDVRPTVCRQYPGTRKHARLTGCRGV